MNTVVIEPVQKAQACMIWMHGLGAGADDMAGLAKQLPLKHMPVRHVALNAPVRPVTLNQGMSMPAWYDITGFSLTDREDKAGILASEQIILDVIKAQIADGFSPSTIFLAGFSQGGAMALFTALRTEVALGGVIALSAYLPLASECEIKLDKKTFRAEVVMRISDHFEKIPADTSASILTQGLLGSNYVGLTPGFEAKHLESGSHIATTHSALILENLIGQLIYKVKNKPATDVNKQGA